MIQMYRGSVPSLLALSLALAIGCGEAADSPLVPGEAPELASDRAEASATWLGKAPPLDPYGVFGRQDGPPARPVCLSGTHRQFDFWLGSYDLTSPGDIAQGTNEITSDLHGCLIEENFIGQDGIRGRSYNAYDRHDGAWLQTFVSELATNFRLTGGPVGARMIMTGPRLFPIGGGNFFPVVERVTWTPLGDGVVNQVVELSTDGGSTFPFVTGDIAYSPVAHPEAAPLVGTNECSSPEFAGLDFWEGEWTVRLDGQRVGKSTITRDLSGCLLEERFTGLRRFKSRSLLSYDFTTDTWHRTIVDTEGNAFRLEGPASAGQVAFEGLRAVDDVAIAVTATLQAASPDLVTQEWTFDGGAPMSLVYERR